MAINFKTAALALVLGGSMVGLSGCASTAADPGDALAMARDALASAQSAEAAAAAAQATADQALAAAQASETCCLNNTNRIERMFQESQQK